MAIKVRCETEQPEARLQTTIDAKKPASTAIVEKSLLLYTARTVQA